ncbi:MAG: hypothetical protein IK094_05340 [Treponema sp.]|nr:hypothetical protein [Treponema sp.]
MELEPTLQREYKDRLFKAIFGRDTEESKRWRLELYNALNGTDYKDPDALELTTIENFIYITMKNDVSFLLDSQMNLYEQQSTFNPNMPLRGLFYFSQLYLAYLNEKDVDIFGKTLVKIPTPRFLVFYNGGKELPDVAKIHLSDAFIKPDKDGEREFEWTATVVNINEGRNEALHKKCLSLYHYSSFVAKVKNNIERGMKKRAAIEAAVDFAINQNYLDGFFKRQREDIIMFSMSEFDQEAYDRHRRREGREEGIEIGAQQKAVEDAVMLVNDFDADPKVAAEKTGAPLEKVLEALAAQPAPAQG